VNCFEARQEFAQFWRRTMKPERRQAFLAHLKDCAGCDRAFRAFALTASVLHSEPEPAREAAPAAPLTIPPRTLERFARVAPARRSRMQGAYAAAAMIATAGLAAYLSAAAPRQSLQDALVPAQEMQAPSNDLTGALIPAGEQVGNDFAG
jgi:hypothetical protein